MPLGRLVCGERLFVQPDWVSRLQCWRWSECVGVPHRQLGRGGPGQLCTGIRCSVRACVCARAFALACTCARACACVRVRARSTRRALNARLRVQRARAVRDEPRPQRVTSGSRRSGAQAAGPPAAIAQEKQVRAPAAPPRLPLLPSRWLIPLLSGRSPSARGNPAAPSRPPFGQRVQAAGGGQGLRNAR